MITVGLPLLVMTNPNFNCNENISQLFYITSHLGSGVNYDLILTYGIFFYFPLINISSFIILILNFYTIQFLFN